MLIMVYGADKSRLTVQLEFFHRVRSGSDLVGLLSISDIYTISTLSYVSFEIVSQEFIRLTVIWSFNSAELMV